MFRKLIELVRAGKRKPGDGDADSSWELRADGGETADAGIGARETSDAGLRARVESLLHDDFWGSMLFWLPPFLLMAFFVYGAISWNVWISLTGQGLALEAPSLEYYRQAVGDPTFRAALKQTILLTALFTGGTLAVGLVLAILVDQKIRFENTFRTIYLLPFSLSFVVTAQFWRWMYNPSSGLVNGFLETLGWSNPPNWLGDPNVAIYAVVFALMWQFSGYAMVVYLAGLRAIPDEHFEAATVDGASTIKMYWRVIIPQLRASTVSALVLLIVFALKAFDFLYSLSGYHPPPGTDILATMMVREAFSAGNRAYGAAIAVILFAMALSFVAPYLYQQHKRGEL